MNRIDNFRRLALGLLLVVAVTRLAVPANAQAGEPRKVSCSVTLTYLLNGAVRAPYQKEFILTPGVPFEDDFSTVIRFRIFDALARVEPDGKTVTVSVSYYNDVGVFETVLFDTDLVVRDDRSVATTTGSHTYWSSLGVAGDHTTDYSLSCQVLKD